MEKLSGKNGTGRRGRPARRSLRHCSEWRLDGSGVTRHFDRLNAARGSISVRERSWRYPFDFRCSILI
jgi:hypothetical protein